MAILMANETNWLVNNWIAQGFFKDCLPYLNKAPQLRDAIQFCIDAEVDTLDLRNEDVAVIKELKTLVSSVLEDNLLLQGSNFYSPEAFPIYLVKLEELNHLTMRSLFG